MSAKNIKLTLLRLQKEEKKLKEQSVQNALVVRHGLLDFHFCIYGLDGPYTGGYYHGLLRLSQQYPFAPPALFFFTPSGRFEVGVAICTTFTNYHKQQWASTWNVRTMVLATISFMTSNELGTGSKNQSDILKRQYASQSLEHNFKNELFFNLFKQQIVDQKLTLKPFTQNHNPEKEVEKPSENELSARAKNDTKIYYLYALLLALIFGFAYYKS